MRRPNNDTDSRGGWRLLCGVTAALLFGLYANSYLIGFGVFFALAVVHDSVAAGSNHVRRGLDAIRNMGRRP